MVASTNIGQQDAHSPGSAVLSGRHVFMVAEGAMYGELALSANSLLLTREQNEANARRAAACWGATSAIPTEVLERIAAEPSDRERLRMLGDAGYDYRLKFPEIPTNAFQL